jgi:hypothetical protein
VGRTGAAAIRRAADGLEAQWKSRLGKRELAARRDLLEETRTRALTGPNGQEAPDRQERPERPGRRRKRRPARA